MTNDELFAKLTNCVDKRTDELFVRLTKYVDKRLTNEFGELKQYVDTKNKELTQYIETTSTELFGKLTRYTDKRFEEAEKHNDQRFDWMYKALDGIVKRLDEDDVDRTITAADIRRHDAWIKKLVAKTNVELAY